MVPHQLFRTFKIRIAQNAMYFLDVLVLVVSPANIYRDVSFSKNTAAFWSAGKKPLVEEKLGHFLERRPDERVDLKIAVKMGSGLNRFPRVRRVVRQALRPYLEARFSCLENSRPNSSKSDKADVLETRKEGAECVAGRTRQI